MSRPLDAFISTETGHFLFESGLHGNLWMDLEALFLRPRAIEPLAHDLARRIASHDLDVVCAPLVEGAFLGLMVARQLDLPFTYSERYSRADAHDLYPFGYAVPRPLHRHVRGKRVAVVNDVISAGSAVTRAAAALDDTFTGFDPAGIVVSKEQWLDDLASGALVFTSIASDDLEFTHAPDGTVHIRGQLTFAARYTRSSYNGSFRYLGVYAQRDGRWKLMLSTARRVAAA